MLNHSLRICFYRYDAGGNLISKIKYPITEKEPQPYGAERTFLRYDADHPDRMTSYGIEKCAYDASGRPTLYRDGTCAWERGNLTRYEKSGHVTTFAYDAHGLRTKQNDIAYTYLGDKLIRQSDGKDTLDFFYDETGLCGIRHNGFDYVVRKNIFGDVTNLYWPDGRQAAHYTYDAWGRPRIYLSAGTQIGALNPFLYRGYYYDHTTGFYYLKTRYYDPHACRFLSGDDPNILLLTADHPNGIMSYSYCGNNPIGDIDDDGRLSWWKKLLIGVGFILVGAVVTALTAGTGAGFMAAFGSALITSIQAVAVSTAISAGIGLVMGGITTGTWDGALSGMLDGAADGFMWGGIFAGGAQILSGGFKIAAQLGANTSKTGFFKVFTPNRLRGASEIAKIGAKGQKYYEYGGTLLKIGKNFIDISNKTLMHAHLWFTGAKHIPLGTILAGIIGGFSWRK